MSKNMQKMMDQLFETFDSMLEKKQFDLVNEMLSWFNVNEMPTEYIIGLLTVTLSWKEKLGKQREVLYDDAKRLFCVRYDYDKVIKLLEGLE